MGATTWETGWGLFGIPVGLFGLVSAISDTGQVMEEIEYGWNGNKTAESSNFLRDTLFSGHQTAYDSTTKTVATLGEILMIATYPILSTTTIIPPGSGGGNTAGQTPPGNVGGDVVEGGSLSNDRVSYYLNESLNNADSNVTILGITGNYDVIGENRGYSYFKMEDEVWLQLENETINNYDEIWKVNKQFIDNQIESGNRIFLSNDPYQGYYFTDGTKRFYQRELDYLKELGYSFESIGNNLWEALK